MQHDRRDTVEKIKCILLVHKVISQTQDDINPGVGYEQGQNTSNQSEGHFLFFFLFLFFSQSGIFLSPAPGLFFFFFYCIFSHFVILSALILHMAEFESI